MASHTQAELHPGLPPEILYKIYSLLEKSDWGNLRTCSKTMSHSYVAELMFDTIKLSFLGDANFGIWQEIIQHETIRCMVKRLVLSFHRVQGIRKGGNRCTELHPSAKLVERLSNLHSIEFIGGDSDFAHHLLWSVVTSELPLKTLLIPFVDWNYFEALDIQGTEWKLSALENLELGVGVGNTTIDGDDLDNEIDRRLSVALDNHLKPLLESCPLHALSLNFLELRGPFVRFSSIFSSKKQWQTLKSIVLLGFDFGDYLPVFLERHQQTLEDVTLIDFSIDSTWFSLQCVIKRMTIKNLIVNGYITTKYDGEVVDGKWDSFRRVVKQNPHPLSGGKQVEWYVKEDSSFSEGLRKHLLGDDEPLHLLIS